RDFIDAKSDQAFREQFLRRIQWDCGQPPLETIEVDLEERIARYASDRHEIPVDEGRLLAGHVLKQVLDTIVHSDRRRLTDLDLRDTVERATSLLIPRNAVSGLMQAASQVALTGMQPAPALAQLPRFFETESGIPLPAILAGRKEVTEDVAKSVRDNGI